MVGSRGRWLAALLVAAIVAVLLTHVTRVHAETGHWGMSVSAAKAPSRLQFEGRDYDRSDSTTLPDDAVLSGHTDGGGTIYKLAGDEDLRELVVIIVSDGQRAWYYSLVGGP